MKKVILALLVFSLTALTACTNNDTNDSTDVYAPSGTDTPATDAPSDEDSPSDESNLSADSSSGEVEPEASGSGFDFIGDNVVYGEVYEVIGNLITLKLIEMPDFNGMNMGDFRGDMTDEEINDRLKEFMGEDFDGEISMEAITDRIGSMMESGEMPQMAFNVDGSFPEGGMTEGDGGIGTPGIVRREQQYTGEEIDIIIPVGLPIYTMARGESGMEEREVNLDSIKAQDILVITYDEDGESISKVLIQQNTGMMSGAGRRQTTNP